MNNKELGCVYKLTNPSFNPIEFDALRSLYIIISNS